MGAASSTANEFSAAAIVTATLLGAVLLLTLWRVLSNTVRGNGPPVFEGIPFIGGLIKFANGPLNLLQDGYAKLGEVFTVPVAHLRITFLLGPHASPHFYKASDDEMSQTEVYKYSVPTFGKGVVFDVDAKVRSEQYKFFAEALSTKRLKSYIPAFVQETTEFFATWGDEGVVDLKEVFNELLLLTASRTLLGREVREGMVKEVGHLFHLLDLGMQPISVIFPYLPIKAHKVRDEARKELAKIFDKVIKERRASGRREVDVLQQYIDAKYTNVYGGRATNEQEITGMLIATLFAGQHTSTVTSTWTGLFMAAHKQHFEKARTEQAAVIAEHGEGLTYDALMSMHVLQRNITEALRMHPPLIMLLRYARRAFTVKDSSGRAFVVPKGDVVATAPVYSHRLDHVFQSPQEYDPDRLAEPRSEDKQLPYSFIGFGGGRHACLGQNFAYLQIKTVWSVLLRNFDFELVDPLPEPDYESMVVGPKACRVRYKRRPLSH